MVRIEGKRSETGDARAALVPIRVCCCYSLLATRYSFGAFCICQAGRLTTVRCRLAYPCATRTYVRGTTIATELGCGAVATSGGTIVTGGGADR
jgi:hypothetical protein